MSAKIVDLFVNCDTIFEKHIPAGIWCENDVGSTSMRRHHVASTLIRRHFGTKCPLGCLSAFDVFESNLVRLVSHFNVCL